MTALPPSPSAHPSGANDGPESSLARQVFAALPPALPPSSLAERIATAVDHERQQQRFSRRRLWGAVASAAAVGLVAVAVSTLPGPHSHAPLVSDAAAQAVFAQWDAEYLASQGESIGLIASASVPSDDWLGLDAMPTPDPLEPIVGF